MQSYGILEDARDRAYIDRNIENVGHTTSCVVCLDASACYEKRLKNARKTNNRLKTNCRSSSVQRMATLNTCFGMHDTPPLGPVISTADGHVRQGRCNQPEPQPTPLSGPCSAAGACVSARPYHRPATALCSGLPSRFALHLAAVRSALDLSKSLVRGPQPPHNSPDN